MQNSSYGYDRASHRKLRHDDLAHALRVTLSTDVTAASGYLVATNGNSSALSRAYAYDAIGDPAAAYRYDPYGLLVSATGPEKDRFRHRFSTKPQDRETGLLYYGYRYFETTTGRWPPRDPIGERGGINLYGFVFNSPWNWIDILGREPAISCLTGNPVDSGAPLSSHGAGSQGASGDDVSGSAAGSNALIIELIGALGSQETVSISTVLAPLPGGSVELYMELTGSVCPCKASDESIGIQFTGTAKAEITGGIGFVLGDRNLTVRQNGKYTNVHRKDDPKEQSIKGLGGLSNQPEVTGPPGRTVTVSSGGLQPCETTGSLQFNIGVRAIAGIGFYGGVVDARFGTFGTAETKWDFRPNVRGSWGTGQPIGLRAEIYGNGEVSGKWATKN